MMNNHTTITASDYASNLDKTHQDRYFNKIMTIGVDPYCLKLDSCSSNVDQFPEVVYGDIVNYLVCTKSAYTFEEMKAYKSLEAYNQVACGWVKKLCAQTFGENILVLGKVMHSQRLNEKLLSPWIFAKKQGEILFGHCDCIAGLGECCTHVAAVLFALDDVQRRREEISVTGKKAYWMQPTNTASDPSTIADLNLLTAKRRKKTEEKENDEPLLQRPSVSSFSPLKASAIQSILKTLSDNTVRGCVMHTVYPTFAEEVKADREAKKCYSLMVHYDSKNLGKSLNELEEIGESLDLSISIDECKTVESETKLQAKCKSWFSYRAGRITASKFKNCCRTKIEKPSLSLIKSICYPQTYKFKNKAMDYGCEHEDKAVKAFKNYMKDRHDNVFVEKLGLFINPKYPYFGASPDGLVECDCCETSLLEIKCPYCARFTGIEEMLGDKKFYLNKDMVLSQEHSYYYQIQMQLAITQTDCCYLVVWSHTDFVVQKIKANTQFWNVESKKAAAFLKKIILPEILGKYFTGQENVDVSETLNSPADAATDDWEILKNNDIIEFYEEVVGTSTQNNLCPELASEDIPGDSATPQPSTSSSNMQLYCICRKADDGKTPMLACDSGYCVTEWYHLSCVGLEEVPANAWVCSNCISKIN